MTFPLALLTGRTHLLVTAHPDDETVSASGVLAYGGHVTIVQLTTGANDDEIALRRAAERAAALSIGGTVPSRIYDGGVEGRHAMYHAPRLLAVIAQAIREVQPDLVWTHPYEGGHVDHDTAAWLVQRLCRSGRGPLRMEFASYHSAGPSLSVFGDFWPDPASPTWRLVLPPPVLERKRAALAAYVSQASVLRKFPDITTERYRIAPRYDFTRPAPPPLMRWDRKHHQPTTAEFRRMVQTFTCEVPHESE